MKKSDFTEQHFQDLSTEEKFNYSGGGFAYDVGRLLRFLAIAGPWGQFTPMAVTDAVLNAAQ